VFGYMLHQSRFIPKGFKNWKIQSCITYGNIRKKAITRIFKMISRNMRNG